MIKEIREELDQLGEESYKQFNQKLIPGTDHVIGVRMRLFESWQKELQKQIRNSIWKKHRQK